MFNFMSKPLHTAILLALPLLCGNAMALEFEEAMPAAYETSASGIGWRLISMPNTNFMNGEFTPPAAALPVDSLQKTGYSSVYIIESLEGLNNSPLPAIVKQDLAGEFAAQALSKKAAIQRAGVRRLQASGVAADDTTDVGASSGTLFVHKGMAEAMAAGTEQALYGNFAQVEDGVDKSLCGSSWHQKTKSGTLNVHNTSGPQSSNSRGGFTGSISANLPVNGNIDYTFKYSYKSNKCLGIPYAMRFDNLRTKGNLSVNDTNLTLDGAISAQYHWESASRNLYSNTWTFFVGPLPVVLGLDVPYQYGIDVNATIAGSLKLNNTAGGTYTFDYTCTDKSCKGSSSSSIQFQNGTPSYTSGFSVNVNAKPYASIEAVGYLYSKWTASAGLGTELSAPSTYWIYQGNNCGDADGNGVNEQVKSAVLDVNAQLALYGKWQVLGSKNWDWLNWPFSVSGWKVTSVNDYTARGKGPFNALRKNIIFKEYENAAGSALTPVIGGSSTVNPTGASFSAQMRTCVPFKDRMNYNFNWGDGTNTAVSGAPNQATFQAHDWNSTGSKTITLSDVSDASGRNYNGINTKRIVNVVPPPLPATPVGLSVPSPSGPTLDMSWNKVSGVVDRYEVEDKYLLANWTTVSSTTSNAAHLTGLGIGAHLLRVRACNITGCGPYSATASTTVVIPPAAPTLSMVVEDLCSGENYASWRAVSGATSYKLLSNTVNDPSSATVYKSTTSTSEHLLVNSNTYFWVKACSSPNACGEVSNYGLARFQFNPRTCN